MNTKKFVEFRKKRDLGDILSDTFVFIRLEFKSFLGTILKITGPYLLVLLASLGAYTYYFGELLQFDSLVSNEGVSDQNALLLAGVVFVMIIASLVTYVLANGAIVSYIQNYTENQGTTNYSAIRKDTFAKFWPLIGLGILVFLSLFVGFMLCIIPGIYLMVPLGLSVPLMIIEKKGVGDAYQSSFDLVKGHWWNTFAAMLVMYIIITVGNYAFALPSIIYVWIKMGVFSGEVDAESMNVFNDPIYLAINILSTLVQFLMNIILLVSLVLIYFNLNERKNSTGALDRISSLGSSQESQ